jgi:hypothetical protein
MDGVRKMSHIALPIAEPAPDRGADGEASLSRPSRVRIVEGRSGGSGKADTVKTEVRRYECECRLDLMRANGLDHRLWAAGMIFRRAWLGSRQGSSVTADYLRVRGERGPLSLVAIEAQQDARLTIDKAMSVLNDKQRLAVTAVCGEDEGILGQARRYHLRRGLERLADLWKPIQSLSAS